jgi:hypothetical protein
MKLFIASDLHGEIRPHGYDVPEGVDFDVVVFAGDIGYGPGGRRLVARTEGAAEQAGYVCRRKP